MPAERRVNPRITVPGQVTGEVTIFQPVTILNISERGVEVETALQLQLEALHDFRLSLGPHSVVVKGRIVHSRIRELKKGEIIYRIGVEFIQMAPDARLAIEAFVEAQRAARGVARVEDPGIPDDGV